MFEVKEADDELDEVVRPCQTPDLGSPHHRPGHGRAIRARQPGVWEGWMVTGTRLPGIGGLFVVGGAVAFVVHIVLRSVLTAGVDPIVSTQGELWVPVNTLGALGAALVLLGLPAIFA